MKFTKIIGLVGLASIGSSFEVSASALDMDVCKKFCESIQTYCGTLKNNKDDCMKALPMYINPGCANVDACKAATPAPAPAPDPVPAANKPPVNP